MKYSIDEAISILQDFVEPDRIIRDVRDNSIESDFDRYCERNNDAIESLIEYVYANKCAFKTSNVINKVETTNTIQLNETDLKKILACLEIATYHVDNNYLFKEDKSLLLDYSSDLGYKISDILGIEDCDSCKIDIETLEVRDNH